MNQPNASAKSLAKVLVSVLVLGVVVIALLMSQEVSWSSIGTALGRFTGTTILAALALASAQIGFMILRFWVLMPRGTAVSWNRVSYAISVGQFVNTFFPARAGDVLKAVLLNKDEGGNPVPMLKGAGTIVADKLVDTTTLVLIICLTGAYAMPGWSVPLPSTNALGVTVMILVLLSAATFPFWKTRLSRVASWAKQFATGFRGMIEIRRLVAALLVGAAAWSAEALSIKVLTAGQGFSIDFSQAVFVLTVLNLAISVPISVGNLGTFEASIVFGLGQLGLPVNESIAIATVHHAIQWLAITGWAGWTAWRIRRERRANSEFRVQLEDKVKALEYFEKVSSNYDGTVSKGILKIPRDLERAAVLKFAQLNAPGKSLIDVGCGAGFYSLEAKKAGMRVHSIDASAGMVMRLQDQVDEAEVADIEKLAMGRTYDRVVCAGVMDFVLHPETAFRNLCKHVSPGGRLVILAPRRGPGGLFYRVEKFFFGIRINLYSREWFRRIAAEYNLALVAFAKPLPTNMALAFEKKS